MPYNRDGRRKYMLQCHLIFVVKYRKKLLITYGDLIKTIFKDQEDRSSFVIETMEVDKDHIHLLLSYEPQISITQIVRRLKLSSTKQLYINFKKDLKREFWKENTFWSDGYFVCSIGEANNDTIRKYIENQG